MRTLSECWHVKLQVIGKEQYSRRVQLPVIYGVGKVRHRIQNATRMSLTSAQYSRVH